MITYNVDISQAPDDPEGGKENESHLSQESTTHFWPGNEIQYCPPQLQVEVWCCWCPDAVFWVVIALGEIQVECLNQGEPFYTPEVAIARGVKESRKRALPFRPDIIDIDMTQ